MLPIGRVRTQIHVRYYVYAILFLIFDVEAVFLFPWAVSFVRLGATALYSMLIFIVILGAGLGYAWKKGPWNGSKRERKPQPEAQPTRAEPAPAVTRRRQPQDAASRRRRHRRRSRCRASRRSRQLSRSAVPRVRTARSAPPTPTVDVPGRVPAARPPMRRRHAPRAHLARRAARAGAPAARSSSSSPRRCTARCCPASCRCPPTTSSPRPASRRSGR